MALGGARPEVLLRDQLLWCSQESFFDDPARVQQTVTRLTAQPISQSPEDFVRQIVACMAHDARAERFFSIEEARQLAGMIPGARLEPRPGTSSCIESTVLTRGLVCGFEGGHDPQLGFSTHGRKHAGVASDL
jgi:hypothetical protein